MKSAAVKAPFKVEPFTITQAHAARELLRENGWQETSIPSLRLLNSAAVVGRAFVATSGERVIGFLRIISDAEIVSYVAEIVVAEEWRNRGVGAALVDASMRRYPNARLDLLSTSAATSFYERAGFTAKAGYRRWP